MTYIESISVLLSPMQIDMVAELRKAYPTFTDEEFARRVVSSGILSLGVNVPDEADPLATVEPEPRRSLGDEITLPLSENLRTRLEKLLSLSPHLEQNDALVSLLELGLESLI